VTGEVQHVLLVMLADEQSAGRITAEIGAFVEFNKRMSEQVTDLEARIGRLMPQLARRGHLARRHQGEGGAA
jgi:hypothetical protein